MSDEIANDEIANHEPCHPDKGPYLGDLIPGDRFIGFYVLCEMGLKPFRDPSRGQYLSLTLGDRSSQMVANVWENGESLAGELEEKKVVKIDGRVETYQNCPQIQVIRVRPSQEDEYDKQDMLPSSERQTDEMLAELQLYVDQVDQEHLRALVDHFFSNEDNEEFLEQFGHAPAGRQGHHAYLGGLLEHTLEMLRLGGTLLELYPTIDTSLLLTGVLLHGIGKLGEFTWDMDIDYSDDGRLLGNVVIAEEMLNQALASMPEFPSELAVRLRHMLISQHGHSEWGPQTMEAFALQQIENLNAQVNRFHQQIDIGSPDELMNRENPGEPMNGSEASVPLR